jgi:hypothetical protein
MNEDTAQFSSNVTKLSIEALERELGKEAVLPGDDISNPGVHSYRLGEYSAVITSGIDVSYDNPSGMAEVAELTGIPLDRFINVVGVGHTKNVAFVESSKQLKRYSKDTRYRSFYGEHGWEYDGVIFEPSVIGSEPFLVGNRYADCPVAVGYIDLVDGRRFCFVQHESAHAIGNGAVEALHDALSELGEIADAYVFVLPGATAIEWERSKLYDVVISSLRTEDKNAYFDKVTLKAGEHDDKVLYNNVLDAALRWTEWLRLKSATYTMKVFGINSVTNPMLHSYRASNMGYSKGIPTSAKSRNLSALLIS